MRPLGAEISHMLADRGVEVIFGIPGVHNQEMYRGIEEAGITHVLARHEQGAGFMADGYARATGRPGVAYVITGPGVCNALTPLGQAYSDSVPVLLIASCLDETAARRGQLHQMRDQVGAARGVCDWSEMAGSAAAAFGLIDRALGEFAMARPRPKAIHVPIAQLEGAAPAHPPAASQAPRAARRPDGAALESVLSLIEQAKRPLLILGGGAVTAPARALAEALGAATFTTYAGRGVLSDDYPLDFGANLPRPGSARIAQSADLVIAIGTELAEVDLWRRDLGHRAPMVRVDIDPEVLCDVQHPALPVMADAGAFCASLLDRLQDHPPADGWTQAEVSDARATWLAELEAERPGILRVAGALRDALPPETMIYSDMTQFAYTSKEAFPMDRPGHWHHPSGFGTLGYALPAAIGGAVARAGLPTLAIAGDYGFQFTLQELGTAVEVGLSLPILLWDNGKLKEIEDSMIAAQIPPNAVVAQNPDFCALAKAYGALIAAPRTLNQMREAISGAFGAGRPTLIYVTPEIKD